MNKRRKRPQKSLGKRVISKKVRALLIMVLGNVNAYSVNNNEVSFENTNSQFFYHSLLQNYPYIEPETDSVHGSDGKDDKSLHENFENGILFIICIILVACNSILTLYLHFVAIVAYINFDLFLVSFVQIFIRIEADLFLVPPTVLEKVVHVAKKTNQNNSTCNRQQRFCVVWRKPDWIHF